MPVVVVTAADLTEEDHQRLNGAVERVLLKQASSRDELLRSCGTWSARPFPADWSSPGGGRPMTRILYVEDNEDNVYMLRRRLERQGFEVLVAARRRSRASRRPRASGRT